MTPKEISSMLAADTESVCRMLLPDGRRTGSEWRAGDVHGSEGKSLGVHLVGSKAGVWADFAAGEGGDLLDLWATAKGVGLGVAIREAKAYLGIHDMEFQGKPARSYKRPDKPRCNTPRSAVQKWLTVERKLVPEAIQAYALAEDGQFVIFPSLRSGELIRWKRRHISDKHNCQTSSDSEPALFGWQAIPEDVREVVITEGEVDAVSWWQLGKPALSVPAGAQGLTWIEAEFDNLERFDVIWLAMDSDAQGQAAVPAIAERLGRERVRNVVLPSTWKDANDLVRAGFNALQVQKFFDDAKTLDPDELKPVEHYRKKVVDIFTGQALELAGYPTPWAKVKDRFRFRSSEVTILAGENFSGKSEACGHFAVDIMSQGERACVASLEFNPEGWIGRIMQQAGCVKQGTATEEYAHTIVDWLRDKLWVFGVVGTSKISRILDVFAYARRRYGIWLFIIDNLQKCGLADDDYNGQKDFVDQLTDFAKEHRAHVVLVHHLNKSHDEAPRGKAAVKGSGGITDMADNVIIWWRNRIKEREIEDLVAASGEIPDSLKKKPDALMIVEKQRNGGETPKILLWFDRLSHQFTESSFIRPRRYLDQVFTGNAQQDKSEIANG